MKKIRFKQENEQPREILGISSLHADFQIAWSVNNALQINLSKTKDVSISVKNNEKSETLNFSLFLYDDSDENYYFLLSNKDNGKNLSSKYKNIDYFFILKPKAFSLPDVSTKISSSEFINGTFIIQTDTVLKKILNKLFEY